MPCRTDGYESSEACYSRMLCYVCTRVSLDTPWPLILKENPELSEWWKRHQEQDRARIKAELETARRHIVRAEALKKLTPEELAALGLNDGFRR